MRRCTGVLVLLHFKGMRREQKIFITSLILVFLAVFAAWYLFYRNKSVPTAPAATVPPTAASAKASASLGTQIYEQAKNPIQNKVPSTQNPAVNPIQGAYKNPF